MAIQIQLRRDLAANWTAANPILAEGEPGLETDTGRIKYGDGTSTWAALAYVGTYMDVDVDAHLNTATAITGEFLSWDGTDYDWAAVPPGYADADVDTHLNYSTATTGQVLSYNGSDYDWVDAAETGGGAPGTFTDLTATASFTSPGIDDNATSTAITIDSNEFVGIGETNPSSQLHVSGTSSTKALFERTGATGAYIGLNDSSANYVYLGDNNGTFQVQTSGSSYSTKMAITPGGNVGIGTPAPQELLDLAASSDPTLRFTNTTTALSNNVPIGSLEFYTSDTSSGGTGVGSSIRSYADDGFTNNSQGLSLRFSTRPSGSGAANTERMRINATGNVGIGNLGANAKLEVTAASGEVFRADAASGAYRIVATQSGVNLNGNVGIGETDPSGYWSQASDLVIAGTSNHGMTIKTPAAGSGRIAFTDTKSSTAGLTDGGLISYEHTSNAMTFGANGAERMRIDSSGNVGIGTDNPLNKLVVSEGTGQHGIELAPGTTSFIQAYDRATADYGDLKIDAQTIAFGTDNGTERMRITSAGDLNVGLNSGTPTGGTALAGVKSGPVLSIGGTDTDVTTGDSIGSMAFISADPSFTATYADGIGAEISAIGETGVGGGYGLAFTTGVTTGSDRAERMRIRYDGNVGIGTDNPVFKISAESAASTVADLKSTSPNSNLRLTNSGGLAVVGSEANDLVFYTSTIEKMRIDSAGKTTIKSLLNVEPSATPGSAVAGDIYYDSTTNKLRCYNGTIWNDLF